MVINNNIRRCFESAFNSYHNNHNEFCVALDNTFPNDEFNKYYEYKAEKDKRFEIPVIGRNTIENLVACNNFTTKQILFVACNNDRRHPYKTADAMLKQMFYSDSVSKVSTESGETYYGSSGIIMDKDFNPLLVCSFKGCVNSNNIIVYDEYLFKINQSVIDSEGTIEKAIFKKYIYYLDKLLISPLVCPTSKALPNMRHSIIIDDMSDFCMKPNAPISSDIDGDIYNCLSKLNITQSIVGRV